MLWVKGSSTSNVSSDGTADDTASDGSEVTMERLLTLERGMREEVQELMKEVEE